MQMWDGGTVINPPHLVYHSFVSFSWRRMPPGRTLGDVNGGTGPPLKKKGAGKMKMKIKYDRKKYDQVTRELGDVERMTVKDLARVLGVSLATAKRLQYIIIIELHFRGVG